MKPLQKNTNARILRVLKLDLLSSVTGGCGNNSDNDEEEECDEIIVYGERDDGDYGGENDGNEDEDDDYDDDEGDGGEENDSGSDDSQLPSNNNDGNVVEAKEDLLAQALNELSPGENWVVEYNEATGQYQAENDEGDFIEGLNSNAVDDVI